MNTGLAEPSAERRRAQCGGAVDAARIPEHEALRLLESCRLDLVADVRERVRVANREVLEPRNDVRLPAAELRAEVAQGVGDGRPRPRIGIDDVVLPGPVVRGVDHWVDRVGEAADPRGELPD